jgi:3-methylcrotonyl-CoA carboxylase alpha subunit
MRAGAAHLSPLAGFTLWAPLRRQLRLRHADDDHVVDMTFRSPDLVMLDTPLGRVRAERGPAGWRLDGQPGWACCRSDRAVTVFDGYGLRFELVDPLDRASSAGGEAGLTLAPMPGRVVAVHVTAGQSVQTGDPLAVLEAMKMEHGLRAARDGRVAEVLVTVGDQVEAGAALVRLEEDSEQEVAT